MFSAVDATHGSLSAEHRAEIDSLVASQFLPNTDLILAVDACGNPLGSLGMDGRMIDALFVDPAHHGRGIGTLLLDHALALAPDVTVDANEQASNALPFHLARGFRITGRSPTGGHGCPYPLVHLAR